MINFLEKDLEDLIMENKEIVQRKGFPLLHQKTFRQFRLPSGSACDILSYSIIGNNLNVRIFELKRDELGVAALMQVIEYGEEVAKHTAWAFDKVVIEVFLVGPDVNHELLSLYAWGINAGIITFAYKVDGISFEAWKNEGFPEPKWISHKSEMITRPPDSQMDELVIKLKNKQ